MLSLNKSLCLIICGNVKGLLQHVTNAVIKGEDWRKENMNDEGFEVIWAYQLNSVISIEDKPKNDKLTC